MEKENEIKLIRRNKAHEWTIINLNTYSPPNKPIVLVLGGTGTNGLYATKGNANIVASMLGVFNDDVELLSVNYNNSTCYSIDYNTIIEKLFRPLYSENGQKIECEKAKLNMRKLTVFAHCFGSYSALEHLVWKISGELDDLNYSAIEQEEILKQIFAISYASDRIPPYISGLSVISLNDSIFVNYTDNLTDIFLNNLDDVNMKKRDNLILKKYKQITDKKTRIAKSQKFLAKKNRCYVLPIAHENNLALIASEFSKNCDDHALKPIKLSEDYSTADYVTTTGKVVTQCICSSLCNSVANSMLNLNRSNLIPFDLDLLKGQLEFICDKINFGKPKNHSL